MYRNNNATLLPPPDRYQAMVHCGSIRQTASIVHMSADCLRTGDKASVHFRFVKHPEFLKVGGSADIMRPDDIV